jgi:hypothetical protein
MCVCFCCNDSTFVCVLSVQVDRIRYQAMVHELIGIKNNRVDMKGVPGVSQELQVFLFSQP